ncbi:MAG: MFS transporter [Candidatus Velthaea sp.]
MTVSPAYRVLALMTGAQIGTAVVQQGLGSLSPALLKEFHLTNAQLGASFTALAIGSALFTVLAGIVVDRYGERPVILWGGIALGLSLIAAAAIPVYPWLVFWLFIFGVTYAAQTPAGGRAVLAWFASDRGLAMSIRQAGVPLGGAIGAVLLPAVAFHLNYRWSLAIGGIIGAISSVLAAWFYVEPARLPGETKKMRALLRGMWQRARTPQTILFTLACMILVSAQSISNAFFTVTAVVEAHASPVIAGAAFAFAQLCAVGGRIVWGRLSDGVFRGDRALPLATIALVVAIDAFALAHAGTNVVMLFIVAGILGFSAAGWNGVFAAAMAEIGGADYAGSILGLGLTFVFLASAAAPPLFGALADLYGLPAAWTALALFALAGIVPPLLAARTVAKAKGPPRRNG